MDQSSLVVSYSIALKNYNQNGRGRSMRKFCEDEGYDYNKFMQFARKGQKELSVLMDADSNQSESSFIPLVVESGSSGALGIAEVRVRFTNGMELIQNDGDINELFGIVRKLLGTKLTEILYIFFGIHTANVNQLADRIEQRAQLAAS